MCEEKTKTQKDLLWGLYQEYRNHARHSETMRANITNYLIVVSAGLLTIISQDGVKIEDFGLAVTLTFVGLFGVVFNASYSERYHRQKSRYDRIREHLDEVWFDEPDKINKILTDAETKHEDKPYFKFMAKISNSHIMWVIFPLIIFAVGVYFWATILKKYP